MKSFLKLLPFIKSQWRLLVVSMVLSIPMSLISSSPAVLIKYLIDNILVKKPEDLKILLFLSFAIVGIYSVNMVVRFFFGYTARLANERIMRQIRERLFAHFVGLSSAFFTENSVGALMSRVMNDVFYVSQGVINISAVVRQIFTFLGVFGYALYLNPKLLLITLTVVPLLSWLSKRSSILMKNYATKMQEANGHVFSALQEAFGGFRVIKAFALERFAFKRFKARNDVYVKFALKAAQVEEVVAPSVELMAALSISLVVYIGGRDVVRGHLSPGDLGAFFTCFALMINPLRTLNDLNMKFSQAGASADRIHEALQLDSSIHDVPHAPALKPFQKTIEFRNISFRYDPEHPWVFQNINFKIRAGQTLAIVGASGQGKSTLVSLLPRFYDPVSGEIYIDDQDIKSVSLKSLRAQIALVTQDVFLFNDTIYNNIASGKESATTEEVHDAARAAFAWDFIQNLPEKFATVVGDRGQRLSGGERQRISIARAILKNSPILILDEATSSLDSASEKAVQAALEKLMEGRTTIVIAHRLSTVRHAHEILVMANGRIEERGTHSQLLEKQGAYAKFHILMN